MSERIKQAIRNESLYHAIVTEKQRKATVSAGIALDDSGQIYPEYARAAIQPLTMHFVATAGQRIMAPQSGKLTLIGTHATTVPTGTLAVRVYQETAASGQTQLVTAYHGVGLRMDTTQVPPPYIDIFAGAWISVDIQTTAGASGVSVSLVINVG